jgi:hypothetical protein
MSLPRSAASRVALFLRLGRAARQGTGQSHGHKKPHHVLVYNENPARSLIWINFAGFAVLIVTALVLYLVNVLWG